MSVTVIPFASPVVLSTSHAALKADHVTPKVSSKWNHLDTKTKPTAVIKATPTTSSDYLVQCSSCKHMFYKSVKSCPSCVEKRVVVSSSFGVLDCDTSSEDDSMSETSTVFDPTDLHDSPDVKDDVSEATDGITYGTTDGITVCLTVFGESLTDGVSNDIESDTTKMEIDSYSDSISENTSKQKYKSKLLMTKYNKYDGESAYFRLFDGTNRVYKKDGSHPKEYDTILRELGLETNLQVVVDEHGYIVGKFTDLNAVSQIIHERVERIYKFYDDKPKPNEIARVCKLVIWTFMNMYQFRRNKRLFEMPHASGGKHESDEVFHVVNGKVKKSNQKRTTFEDDMDHFVKQSMDVLKLQKHYGDVIKKDRNLHNKFMLINRFHKYFGY